MPQDMPYYLAFQKLNAARQPGMNGPCPLMVAEVLAYLQLVGIAIREERVKYLDLVQELDNLCLEHWDKEAKKQA
jgi:hypothetical protein